MEKEKLDLQPKLEDAKNKIIQEKDTMEELLLKREENIRMLGEQEDYVTEIKKKQNRLCEDYHGILNPLEEDLRGHIITF